MSLMQGEVAIFNDENETEKVDDGKRSKVEPPKRSSIWDFDFDEDDYSKEPGYVKQDLTLFPSFVMSDDYTGGGFTLCDSDGHDDDEDEDEDDDDNGELTLIPGMVVPPCLLDFTKRMFAKSDDKTVVVSFLDREITEDSQLLELFKPIANVSSATLAIAPTGISGRYGFVTFVTKEDAQKAIKELNGRVYDKRTLKVDWATPRKT